MSSAVDVSKDELSASPSHISGVRGHGILAVGPDEDGLEALAVWQVGTTGRAESAWTLPFDSIQENAETLQQIMALFRHRCLIDWSRDRSVSIVDRIAGMLPERLAAALLRNILVIPDLLEEIVEWRCGLVSAVEDHRSRTNSKLTPLVWPSEVPDQAELLAWSVIAQRGTSPVAADALTLTAAVGRVVDLWQETEQARYRRTYLRSFGDPKVLPPRWTARLHAATSN